MQQQPHGGRINTFRSKNEAVRSKSNSEFFPTHGVSFGTSLEKVTATTKSQASSLQLQLQYSHEKPWNPAVMITAIHANISEQSFRSSRPSLVLANPKDTGPAAQKTFKEQPQECEEERKGTTGLQQSRDRRMTVLDC